MKRPMTAEDVKNCAKRPIPRQLKKSMERLQNDFLQPLVERTKEILKQQKGADNGHKKSE